jgi:hypothetical protein
MDRWRYELLNTAISTNDSRGQARGINRLAELALYHAAQIGDGFPVKWAAQRLSKIRLIDRNFGLMLSVLLRFSRDFPACMNIVVVFIINHKKMAASPKARTVIEGWVKAIFRDHIRHSHDFEAAWALVVCGALKIAVSKADFGDYSGSICSVVFATLGLLKSHELLKEPLSSFGWKSEVKKSGINSHHWLMYYESVLRGWTNDKDMIFSVKSHDLLGHLFKAKITFLDDAVFGNVNINLDRRRMKPIRPADGAGVATEGVYDDGGSFGLASL